MLLSLERGPHYLLSRGIATEKRGRLLLLLLCRKGRERKKRTGLRVEHHHHHHQSPNRLSFDFYGPPSIGPSAPFAPQLSSSSSPAISHPCRSSKPSSSPSSKRGSYRHIVFRFSVLLFYHISIHLSSLYLLDNFPPFLYIYSQPLVSSILSFFFSSSFFLLFLFYNMSMAFLEESTPKGWA